MLKGIMDYKQKFMLGMPTLIEYENIEQNISLCKELNLSFIELNMNLPQYQIENIEPAFYSSLMSKHNIFFTLHLPEEINVSDFNPRVKEAYIKTISDSIELAKNIGIPIINMHLNSGVYFTMPSKKVYLFDKYFNQYMQNIKYFGNLAYNLIKEEDICICIENIGNYNLEFVTEAVEELLSYRCFKLTWDIGHDHSCDCVDSRFILSYLNSIRHFHLHDAIGAKNHLPLGLGEIDIQSKINIAKGYNCTCVIETKTIDGLRKSVEIIGGYT